MNKEMLTTDDLAEYLNIHKNQIYRLIKEKRLPATRVTGKWLFPKKLVDEWVISSAKESVCTEREQTLPDSRIVIAGSNDIALEMLTENVNIRFPKLAVSLSNVGSLAGLKALQRGTCHIAASHLLDTETGEYNSSYVRQHFPGLNVRIINLAHREQGLLIKKGNPLGIKRLEDLVSRKAAFVNRQDGSGTRVLLDFMLKEKGIDPSEIPGYGTAAFTHLDVGVAILRGSAQAGMGIRAAAQLLGLDFIPLAKERFDLVVPSQWCDTESVSALCQSLALDDFKASITRMGGYDTCDTGGIMYEKG